MDRDPRMSRDVMLNRHANTSRLVDVLLWCHEIMHPLCYQIDIVAVRTIVEHHCVILLTPDIDITHMDIPLLSKHFTPQSSSKLHVARITPLICRFDHYINLLLVHCAPPPAYTLSLPQ